MLRDLFVSGLFSEQMLRAALNDCKDGTFNKCVERAKLMEQLTAVCRRI